MENTTSSREDLRTKTVAEMNKWGKNLCKDAELNFERNDLYPVDQMKIFREAISKYKSKLTSVTQKVNNYKDNIVCNTTPTPDECVNVEKAKEIIERIDTEMADYLPKEVKPLPAFELYEIVYNKDGNFDELKKKYSK